MKRLFRKNTALICGMIIGGIAIGVSVKNNPKALEKLQEAKEITMIKGHQAIAVLTSSHAPD